MKTIYDPRYRSMIKWLIEVRKKQGLTQVQVATKLGVPRTRITQNLCVTIKISKTNRCYIPSSFWDVFGTSNHALLRSEAPLYAIMTKSPNMHIMPVFIDCY